MFLKEENRAGRGRNSTRAINAPQPVANPTKPARREGEADLRGDVTGSSVVVASLRDVDTEGSPLASRAGVMVSSEDKEGEVEW